MSCCGCKYGGLTYKIVVSCMGGELFYQEVEKVNDLLQKGVEKVRGHGRSEQVYLFSLLILHKSWARVRFLESNLGSKWRELGRAQGSR